MRKNRLTNWPSEPIKALGVFFTYDQTLLYEKNFQHRLDDMKKLTNIWSSRGLSIYGKVTIIKSLLIPKLVYSSTLLPIPTKIIKKANHIIYSFLWKGKDKVTRLSAINTFENGGIRMIDLDSMVKALRLAWLKRTFSTNVNTWKTYFMHLLGDVGGSLIFQCNYTMKDLPITSIFYRELLQWWAEFRDLFSNEKDWVSVIWNNKDIRINGKSVFYKTYFDSGIHTVSDLSLHLNNIESFNAIRHKMNKGNFLTWTGLRHSIPPNLKISQGKFTRGNPSLRCGDDVFDITKRKSKYYYTFIVTSKAQLPNNAQKLKHDFNLTGEELKRAFILPHTVAYEPYVKAFQFKILNSIIYTNKKLFKIGYSESDRCSFCNNDSETLHHLFFNCPYSNIFWKHFENYYFMVTNQRKTLGLQEIIIGITTTPYPLLNYLLLIAKIHIWDCRRNRVRPDIERFKCKIKLKYEIEKYIATKNHDLKNFNTKWAKFFSFLSLQFSVLK